MKLRETLPLVSLVITCYNRQGSVIKSIESALTQDYVNLEIIIADNASTDGSPAVIRRYISDPRIRFFENPVNIGMLPNFKRATNEFAKGELITYVSSDDYLVNNKFVSEAVAAFKAYESLVAFSAVSKSFYVAEEHMEHNTSYEYKESRGLTGKLLTGRFVFLEFQYAHLLNFGGTVFYRSNMISMDVFRENNTTYADLQVILLLALKGDFYLSGETAYVQSFHEENASQVATNAEKALFNLNYAEIPFEAAKQTGMFSEAELTGWLNNILKAMVHKSMIAFYKTNKEEYRKYVRGIASKYPEVYRGIYRKWKYIRLTYRNPVLRFFYNKYLQLINAKN